MRNIISIILIILTFLCFSFFEALRHSVSPVLSIINPTTIQIDINRNGKADIGETFCIPKVETFTSNLSVNQSELTDKLNISKDDAIRYGYLTDIFAENMLADKKVKLKKTNIKNENCIYADIIINNESYRNKLLLSGYGFDDGIKNEHFENILNKAKSLNLVILNHKSNKYHKLDCEYGLVANDSIIIPENYLTDAAPCKFCHVKPEKKSDLKNTNITYPLIISNGSVKLYLTDSTQKLKPDDKCESSVCQMILKEISESKSKIDIALYGWGNVPPIYNELVKAKQRGVKIRIVYDISTKNYYPKTEEFVLIADASSHDTTKSLMHNKFIVFDDKKLVTGSMNFSQTGLSGFNTNSVILIESNEIAEIYEREFEQMLSGKFQNSKQELDIKTVKINDTKITPLFSPKNKTIEKFILPLIDNSKHYVYVPTFTLTHKKFAEALIAAKKRGVNVKVIVDATKPSTNNSYIKVLRDNKISVKTENYAGKMHSKSIIIDDNYIVIGSMNFTNSGENYNDENSLIIEDERLAKYYKGFFDYYWSKIPDKYLKFNPAAESKASIGSCYDGIDNNYDGKVDSEDKNCN